MCVYTHYIYIYISLKTDRIDLAGNARPLRGTGTGP